MSVSLATVDVSGAETGLRHGVVRRLLRRPLAVISACVLAVMVVIAIIQPWIMPFPPHKVILSLTNALPFTSEYVLGGDKFGRDILSNLIAGTRDAILSGLILTTVAIAIGTAFGLLAGYVEGIVDTIISGVFAVLMAVPGIILLIALYTLVDVSMPVAMGTLGVLSSTGVFLIVRSLTRNVRGELYVDAARVSGLPVYRIIGRHVLLAIRGPIIILGAFFFGGALAVSAGLEFLGLGTGDSPSWGGQLNDAFVNYYMAPWQLIWPGLVLGLGMAASVLLGNAIRDVLEGTYIKPSARARRAEERRLLGDPAARVPVRPSRANAPLLQITELSVGYPSGDALRTVVDAVSIDVRAGEVVGLVGESGSGKSQTVFATLGLLPDQAMVSGGSVRFEGEELLDDAARLNRLRGSQIAYVPQEPMANLDPSFRVGAQLVEGIRAQTGATRAEARATALACLARVGIRDPEKTFHSFPHEISGGMAQRVLIAGAVASRPRLLIADEPTTALDVTVQADVLDLLRDLQSEIGMAVLIVTHNLGVVADLCDRVVVMRNGEVVEAGDVRDVLGRPQHEYTRSLLDALLDDAAPRLPLQKIGAADE